MDNNSDIPDPNRQAEGVENAALGPQSPPQAHKPTILIIDDDEVFVELLSDELSSHFVVEWAKDGQTAQSAVLRRCPDTIFLDHGLPDIKGVELIDELRKVGCEAPVVMLTASQDVRVAADAMRAGAVDFIVKDIKSTFYADIVPTAARAVEKWNNEKELEYLREQEEEQARRAVDLNRQLRHKNGQIEQAYQEIEVSHQQLRQKNQRLSELYETAHRFVDNVSHEMRTPLTVVKEFLSIVMDGLAGDVNEQQLEYLGIAMSKTNDLARMVDDMLDISKIEAGLLRVERSRWKFEDVLSLVEDALLQKSRSSQINLDINIEPGLPDLYCDREKIGRVLINLVVNAMKFSPESSTINLEACRSDLESEILVGVSDEGPGIAAEHLKIIFERFKQVGEGQHSSTKGFGLGLNIVRELVNLNLGEVYVESQLDRGSSFSFTIPVLNHELLMRRYLDRLHTYDTHGKLVFFFRAYSANSVSDMSGHIKEFLAHHLTAFDLTFERPEYGDVILAAVTDDPQAMVERLRVKNREELRMSPGSTVDLEFEALAEHNIVGNEDVIVSDFVALFASGSLEKTDAS